MTSGPFQKSLRNFSSVKAPQIDCRGEGLYCLDTTPPPDNRFPAALTRKNPQRLSKGTTSLILEASTEHALIADNLGNALHLPGGPALSKCLGAEVQKFVANRSFHRVIIGAGPGSFTGIRVVAAMGQALAFGWGVPLYTVSSLTAFAPEEENFAVALDARSGGLYVQIGFCAPQLLKLEEASALLLIIPLITSPHPNKILQRLPQLATCQWRESKPNPLKLEQHAMPASQPLILHYLSTI